MAEKKVAVLVRHSPLNNNRDSEALRMSVGLTMAENSITVYLLDAAAWLAVPLAEQAIGAEVIKKHIDALLMLKAQVVVEAESLERCRIDAGKVIAGVGIVTADAIARDLGSADVVIPF